MWFRKYKWKIIIPLLIAAVLVGVFFLEGSINSAQKLSAEGDFLPYESQKLTEGETHTPNDGLSHELTQETPAEAPVKEDKDANAKPSAAATNPPEMLPAEKPAPPAAPSPSAAVESTELSCTISVSCAALLNNLELLPEEQRGLVPESGYLLAPVTVSFTEGESVFDILQRTLIQYGIHLEFVDTPAYNSAYIEGIGNLYELDAGSLSGWMYSVNGSFPNYGCSKYKLLNGDSIKWLYTCDLGEDIGGRNNYQ